MWTLHYIYIYIYLNIYSQLAYLKNIDEFVFQNMELLCLF